MEAGATIINIGSGCNKWPFPKLVDYTTSKGGIEALTKSAAVELGPHGIRVNCVAPGAIEIERTKTELADYAGTWARLTPLGRVGLPADVGNAVVLLASGDSELRLGGTATRTATGTATRSVDSGDGGKAAGCILNAESEAQNGNSG